ncbi:MAG TPA: DUF5715 family protein [Pyrinomonadaceae bacterium]|nr:DUF5715 family protein [Pyrinomonadaceae bacterium]
MGFRGFKGAGRFALTAGLLAVAVVFSLTAARHKEPHPSVLMPAPPTVEAAELDPYLRSVSLVEEERETPMGRQADVAVPAQLKHYSDSKRFLALQVAEARRLKLEVPTDYAALAGLIRAGEMVELPAHGENHVLYGVGLSEGDGPFTHYEERKRRSVRLLAGPEELSAERARLAESAKALDAELSALREEIRETDAKDKTALAALRSQAAAKTKELEALKKERELLAEGYAADAAVRRLSAKHSQVARLAADFAGEAYSMESPVERRKMKVRMLSHLRPAARDVLEEVGRAYRGQFGRPLPVTSVVRTVEYQNRLSKTNSNATRIETPPHSTGLAFDIFYRYMDAEEQDFLMAELARLKDAGRIEVLRERRDHFHVFAFAGGRRPEESLVNQVRSATSAADEDAAEAPRPMRRNPEKKSAARKAAEKKADAKKPAAKSVAKKADAKKGPASKARRGR